MNKIKITSSLLFLSLMSITVSAKINTSLQPIKKEVLISNAVEKGAKASEEHKQKALKIKKRYKQKALKIKKSYKQKALKIKKSYKQKLLTLKKLYTQKLVRLKILYKQKLSKLYKQKSPKQHPRPKTSGTSSKPK